MNLKVVHFSGNYYVIKYRLHWWMPYRNINEPDTRSSHPTLNHLNGFMARPLMMPFHEAKALAESFTEDSLRAYLAKQIAEFNHTQDLIRHTYQENKRRTFRR